jgi:hypothetical protein
VGFVACSWWKSRETARRSPPQGSTHLYLELINRNIPAELHIYEIGGHGFGMRSRPGATGPTDWQQRAIDWLRLREYATAP